MQSAHSARCRQMYHQHRKSTLSSFSSKFACTSAVVLNKKCNITVNMLPLLCFSKHFRTTLQYQHLESLAGRTAAKGATLRCFSLASSTGSNPIVQVVCCASPTFTPSFSAFYGRICAVFKHALLCLLKACVRF